LALCTTPFSLSPDILELMGLLSLELSCLAWLAIGLAIVRFGAHTFRMNFRSCLRPVGCVLALVFLVAVVGLASAEEAPAEEDPALEAFLWAESRRLAALRLSIEQPDAAVIAAMLPEEPSAHDLRAAVISRYRALCGHFARRVELEHPDFHDSTAAWARRYPGENGWSLLQELGDGLQLLQQDREIYGLLHAGIEELDSFPAALVTRVMTATDHLPDTLARALAAEHLFIPPQQFESHLADVSLPPLTYIARAAGMRALLLARSGEKEQAVREFTSLMEVIAKMRVGDSLIGSLVLVVVSEMALVQYALPLADNPEVEIAVLRQWLELGRAMEPAMLRSVAVELAQGIRLMANVSDELASHMVAELRAQEGEAKVESLFADWRKWLGGRLDYLAWAASRQGSPRDKASLEAARESTSGVGFLMYANFVDAAKAHWIWAALDMRILERERGALSEHMDAVHARLAEAWPALRAEFRANELQLWVRPEHALDMPQRDPLVTLQLSPR
jgi:hypothetical protein